MAGLNPFEMVTLLKQGNPKAFAQQVINTNYPNDPNMQRLLQLAEKGDIQSLQQIAEQSFSRQGKNFQTEMNSFFESIKNL